MDAAMEIGYRSACDLASPDETAWVIGVARLAELPVEHPRPGPAEILEIIASATRTGYYPTGAIADAGDVVGEELQGSDLYLRRVVRARHRQGGMIEQQVGFGTAGFVGYGFTRRGCFDVDPVEPSHILLSDVEAAITETVAVSVITSIRRGYVGPIDFVVGAMSRVPGHPMRVRVLDEEDATVRPVDDALDSVPLVEGRVYSDMTVDQLHARLYETCVDLAHALGLVEPQLLTPPPAGTPAYEPAGAAQFVSAT